MLIGRAWRRYPDLRLGQMIMGAMEFAHILNKNLFYLEDDVLYDAFEKYLAYADQAFDYEARLKEIDNDNQRS
jgi:hypothetical protein